MSMETIFGPVIDAYTRAQAIEDGTLVDVSGMAREAGFKIPVALTRTVWGKYVEVPKGVTFQDESGRLWDILWMLHVAIAGSPRTGDHLLFRLHVRNDNRDRIPPLITLKALCGPGDHGEPVMTILTPEED